jgi:hypothetical protein
VSRFISNEVIFRGSQTELTAFLARYNGKVISTIAASLPRGTGPQSNLPPPPPSSFVIRLDSSPITLEDLDADAERMGLRGQMKFSSDSAARLAALVAGEVAAGSKVALNFVSEGHDFPTSTAEQADLNGIRDAFQWPEFDRRAWQFVAAHGIARRVKVAIIDGGFWLNSAGIPCDLVLDATCLQGPGATAKGLSDLPQQPMQFNVIGGGSPFAGGPNPTTCTNGTPCPWHGNKSASVALAVLNNGAGAAGTGGQVADPILLKFDGSDDAATAAVLDAAGSGADIISMSFGGSCNDWCRLGHDLGGLDSFWDFALDSGILLVASAGNDSANAGDRQEWPCQYSSDKGIAVYCVGALNSVTDGNGYFVNNDGTAAPYSNFGTAVNIWAPTNIHAMPDGGSQGQLPVHRGTSASAPYVAGVAAMMKAINPSLDGEHLKAIIGNGPYTVGTAIYGEPYLDPKVSLVIQPYKAVVAAAGGYHLAPELRIIAPQDGATIQPGGFVPVQFKASALDVNDGQWPQTLGNPSSWWGWPRNPNPPSIVSWKSDVDGPFPESGLDTTGGTSIAHDFTNAPEGLRHVTASVTNSAGITSTATIAITIAFPHVKPTPVITWPPPGTIIPAGTYVLTGYAKSTNPGVLGNFSCDRLVWNGNIPASAVPNSNGLCQAQVTLAPGIQQISLSATDKFGDTGTTTVSVRVQPAAGLVVQILNPRPGYLYNITMGAGTSITLDGNATPIQPNSFASYGWYWYTTSAGVATKHYIGGGLFFPGYTWKPESSGLCTTTATQNLTIRLEAADTVPSDSSKNTAGSSEVNIELVCNKIT